MLKTIVLLNIFVQTVIHFNQDSLKKKTKKNAFIWFFCNNFKVFTYTVDQINALLLNKNINKKNWPQTF